MSTFRKSMSLQTKSIRNRVSPAWPQQDGFVTIPVDDLEAAIRSKVQSENSAWSVKNVSITVEIAKEVSSEPEESLIIPVKDSEATGLEGKNSASVDEITQDEHFKPKGGSITKSVDELEVAIRAEMESASAGIDPKDRGFRFIESPTLLKEKSFLYTPRVISIGPHFKSTLGITDKWGIVNKYLSEFKNPILLGDYIKYIKDVEEEARGCYERDIINLSSDEFVQIMLLDSFTVIVFLTAYLFNMRHMPIWDIPYFFTDFILLENQVPFFIIRKFWDIMKSQLEGLEYLDSILQRCVFWKEGLSHNISVVYEVHHLLELYYRWNVPIPARVSNYPSSSKTQMSDGKTTSRIQSATELYEAGIEFKPKKDFMNMFDISFENGVLEIPTLILDSTSMSLLTNLLSYEITKDDIFVASYVFLFDSLINSKEDVALLQKCDVFYNKLASDDEAAAFINSLGDSMLLINPVNVAKNFYAPVINDILNYSASPIHRNWTSFKHTYFSNPWTGISLFAGIFLLLLSCVQTYYAIFPRN